MPTSPAHNHRLVERDSFQAGNQANTKYATKCSTLSLTWVAPIACMGNELPGTNSPTTTVRIASIHKIRSRYFPSKNCIRYQEYLIVLYSAVQSIEMHLRPDRVCYRTYSGH